MEEKDAIELLGKLEKFMTDTATAIHNLQVDVNNLKKQANQNRILIKN